MTQSDNLTKEEKSFVKSFMHSSILFQNLDSKDEEIIMKAMTVRETEEYEVIVKEGETGNYFYIIS
jgi:signal-transduction protein with cAMP-binding, CBS, and nucleotidyltransferase domain